MDKKTSVSVDIWTLLDVCNITVVQPNPSTDIVGTVEYVSNNHTGCSVSIVEFIMERLPIRQVTLYVYIHIKLIIIIIIMELNKFVIIIIITKS